MTDEITLDAIEKLLWEVTKFQIDQAQVDAFKVLVESRVSQQAAHLAKATPEVVQAQLATLTALARQLLDTGGRMRLDPAGQLDVSENPVATRADVEALGRKLLSLQDAVQALARHGEADNADFFAGIREMQARALADMVAREEAEGQPVAELPQWEADLLAGKIPTIGEQREADLVAAKLPAIGKTGIDALRGDPGFADVVAANEPVLDEETREQVARALKPKRRKLIELNPDGTLTCTQCGVAKTTGNYFRNTKSRLGYETKCRSCRSASKAA